MMHLGIKFEQALIYTLHVHGGHMRKGTSIPYFSHLMGVAATVIEDGGTEDEAIAALLHDAVEDQGGRPRLADIKDRFGSGVAKLVEDCSDSLDGAAGDQKEEWGVRKRKYMLSVAHKSPSALRVTVADKLHNARSIYPDAQTHGGALWARFNKPPEQSIAYYSAFYEAVRVIHDTPATRELGDAVRLLESLIADRQIYDRWYHQLLPF